MSVALISGLRTVVERRASVEAMRWFDDALALAGDSRRFAAAFASASRRVGAERLEPDDVDALQRLGLAWSIDSDTAECARGALLLAAMTSRIADDQTALVHDLVRRGEISERQAVLRVLIALPNPDRFVELARDACRTNIATVFNAIACDNEFPARFFPDPAFNQMVLKALFIGAPVSRIRGLAARTTDELVRMVDAFASERRAAGRDVPSDVSSIRRTS